MTRQKQTLFAAVTSTACAVVWLVNYVLDVALKAAAPGQTVLHALCTVVWAASAALWWTRWHGSRRSGKDAQAS